MGKESKKKKIEINALKEVSDCTDTLYNVTEDAFEQSKNDKRKKYKKKTEVSTVVELDGCRNEHIKDYEEGHDNYLVEKEKKRVKKRKLEPLEGNDKSDKEIHMVGEDRTWLQIDDGKDVGNDKEVQTGKEKKRRKEGSKKVGSESPFLVETSEDKERDKYEVVKEQISYQTDNIAQMKNGIKQIEKNKKKKGRRDEQVADFKGKKKTTAVGKVGNRRDNYDVNIGENVEKKKGKKEGNDDLGDGVREMMAGELCKESTMIGDKDLGRNKNNTQLLRKKTQETETEEGNKGNCKKFDSVETCPENPKCQVKSKGVRFSDRVDVFVFPSSDGPGEGKEQNHVGGRVQAKFFTPEEDEKIKESVFNYIKAHNLGEEGLHMILDCKSYPELRGCWKEIGAVFANRPREAIRYRAHVLFERDKKRSRTAEYRERGIVQGKRFTPEEDEKIKESVFKYIKAHNLGEEGLHMILHCKSYPKIRNCWKDIGAVFGNRLYVAIRYRAHTLFERDENRSWTAEDLELVRSYHEKHGPKWKELADVVGKHRVHLKDAWRRIKLPNKKSGHWSQEEYQSLFDSVNTDLQLKAFEEKKTKHGMLRDNISWTAISDKLSTRTNATCCMKWYDQLTSRMVAEGKWANVDDYHLLDALFSLDACCIEDVDWDNLLDHRSGDICRKRWNQMVNHVGEHGNKLFAEQVEVLSKRYCPDLLEAREAWDSKPVVD